MCIAGMGSVSARGQATRSPAPIISSLGPFAGMKKSVDSDHSPI